MLAVRQANRALAQLLKCVHNPPEGLSPKAAKEYEDEHSVLLRAYGNDTSILIDRERECASHLLLSKYKLAPPLLARFSNGLLYRYVAGRVCSVDDLAVPETWRAVARRLGEWHGVLPRYPATPASAADTLDTNLWGVIRKWISVLPTDSDATKTQKAELERELKPVRAASSQGCAASVQWAMAAPSSRRLRCGRREPGCHPVGPSAERCDQG